MKGAAKTVMARALGNFAAALQSVMNMYAQYQIITCRPLADKTESEIGRRFIQVGAIAMVIMQRHGEAQAAALFQCQGGAQIELRLLRRIKMLHAIGIAVQCLKATTPHTRYGGSIFFAVPPSSIILF